MEMTADGGEGTHILIGATSSPTVAGLIERLRARYPAMRFHSYSPISDPLASPELIYRFDHVDTVLSLGADFRSEEHTSELQSLMRISYAVFCLKKKNTYEHSTHLNH